MQRRSREHYQACLLGGAVGDALGASIEFLSLAEIRRRFGPAGLTDYAPAYGREGAITDDTQMTLFTAEAVLRGQNRARERGICSIKDVARLAYFRWLKTQGHEPPSESYEPGWLIGVKELHSRRAPGNTCLSALEAGARGSRSKPQNDSKGCGAVMRMAPVGLVGGGLLDPFGDACRLGALTHGHPSGFYSAGAFALIVHALCDGKNLRDAAELACERLRAEGERASETCEALEGAIAFAGRGTPTPERLQSLGGGWVGEEALAIGLCCALVAESFSDGALLAVNHGGDSDSTGSIAGNLLGLIHGLDAIPASWLARLELREVIAQVALDLWTHFGDGELDARLTLDANRRPSDWDRYPGN